MLSHQLYGEDSKKIDGSVIHGIARTTRDLIEVTGDEVILVTSGAALAGCYRDRVPFPQRSDFKGPHAQQKYADRLAELAVAGTITLGSMYEAAFANEGMSADYCLITNADVQNDEESPGIRRRINSMLANGRVPVVNTNDFATIEELLPRYGSKGFDDNDRCAYVVAEFSQADRLYLVTTYMLHEQDPSKVDDARRIDTYSVSDPPEIQWGGKSINGRGGMRSKVDVACRATNAGIEAHIITLDMLPRVSEDPELGTTFVE